MDQKNWVKKHCKFAADLGEEHDYQNFSQQLDEVPVHVPENQVPLDPNKLIETNKNSIDARKVAEYGINYLQQALECANRNDFDGALLLINKAKVAIDSAKKVKAGGALINGPK
jgi:uncharacterized protein